MPELRTHCPFCAFQCGMLLTTSDQGELLGLRGDPEFPVNRGQLCIKGAESHALLKRSDRLLKPLVRDATGVLREATWELALSQVAERLAQSKHQHGAASLGVFGSGGLTNEKAYALGKFARVVLGTPHIDYNGRYCMSSAAAAQNRAFGLDRGLPFPVSDIATTDCILSWGSNWVETMPPIRQWFELQRERGGRLIVVDPRRTETAQLADLYVSLVPGTDLAVANGLLYLTIEQNLIDQDYITRRTTGFDEVRRSIQWYTPDRVERISGVSERTLRTIVSWMTSSPRSLLLSGRGAEQQSKGVDTVHAFINLMLAIGKVGTPGAGYACLTGQGNGQGGREHGQKSDQLPGYRSIENDTHRRIVADAWGVSESALPRKGKSAFELLDALGPGDANGGGIRTLLVMGSNLAVASPMARHVEERLRSLDLLVVLDSFLNETARLAHVVLPTLLWTEEAGTLTNLEGRVLLRRVVTAAPSGPRSDLAILRDLGVRLGAPTYLRGDEPSQVFDELAQVTEQAPADYSGLSHERLRLSQGVHWPCSKQNPAGTPRMFSTCFAHPDGKAKFFPVEYRDAGEIPDSEYPLYFTTGRVREHYNSGAQTRGIDSLERRKPEPVLEVHPACLARFGLTEQTHVQVETRRARVRFRVQVTRNIREDTLFVPFHFGGRQAANQLTSAHLDPTSRMPEFKICAAKLLLAELP